MFNLEEKISEWRQQMLAAGIQTPVPLEELEIHLREEIGRQVQSGAKSQDAFEISVRQIGRPGPLENEFKKIGSTSMKQTVKIVAVLLLGVVLQFPGSFQLRDELVMGGGKLGLWLLGLVLQMRAVRLLWRRFQHKFTGREPGKIEISFPKPTLKTGAGVGVLLFGAALMLPADAQVCREDLVIFDALCWLVLGLALLTIGAVVTFCPFKGRKVKYV